MITKEKPMNAEEKKLLQTAIAALSKLAAADDDSSDDTDAPANAEGKQAGQYPLRKKFDDDAEALAATNARRVAMGLAPKGPQPKAFDCGLGKYQFSHHALAQSKRVRA